LHNYFNITNISALPTQSPARQCLKFERRRSNNVVANKQQSTQFDNSISSNEYQGGEDEEGENDYNNELQDYGENSTQNVSAHVKFNATISKHFLNLDGGSSCRECYMPIIKELLLFSVEYAN
jgi:hypothetical protein